MAAKTKAPLMQQKQIYYERDLLWELDSLSETGGWVSLECVWQAVRFLPSPVMTSGVVLECLFGSSIID